MKRAKEEVIEVHGGRIVRSLGRKDKHSKVCTARGMRDRRVRLSPNTAIQFYDVQDRLGYDRPSKAIDWLIKEAKAAIDALEDPPAANDANAESFMQTGLQDYTPMSTKHQEEGEFLSNGCRVHSHEHLTGIPICSFSSFSMETGATPSPSTEFHSYPDDESHSRSKIQQALYSSFNSLQENSFLSPCYQPSLFSASAPSHSDISRIPSWDYANLCSNIAKGATNSFSNSAPIIHFQPMLDQNQVYPQREPLQSSIHPPIHAPSSSQFASIAFDGNDLSKINAASVKAKENQQHPVLVEPHSATSFLYYEG